MPQMITIQSDCPGSGSPLSDFPRDVEFYEYLPYATCPTCGVPIMLLCAEGCTGSHDYRDEPPCELKWATHTRAEQVA